MTSAARMESIPEGLRDVIGKRLNKLSPACNHALGAASVVGREFALETLRHVVTVDEEPLLAALEEAQAARVLEDWSASGEVRFRFTHALFREMLYGEIFTPRRLKTHQAVADALEKQYAAAHIREHSAELAEHFAHSTDSVGLEKALRYAEMAADRANSVYAYAEAVRHLRRALDILRLLGTEDQSKRCDLLLAPEDPGRRHTAHRDTLCRSRGEGDWSVSAVIRLGNLINANRPNSERAAARQSRTW